MFTFRELPENEWERLTESPVYLLVPWLRKLDKDQRTIVVVEHEGRIVATQALFAMPHLEGIWFHPDFRKHTAPQRLMLRWISEQADALDGVMTASDSDEVSTILRRLGATQIPMTPFWLPRSGVESFTRDKEE